MLLYLRIDNCRPHVFYTRRHWNSPCILISYMHYIMFSFHLNFLSPCANLVIYPYKQGTYVCLYLQER